MKFLKDILGGLVDPIAGIFRAREERKTARETAAGKLAVAKQEGFDKMVFSDQDWESIAVKGTEGTWKDEYVTISIVSIINLLVVGGIAAAFGYGQILQGLSIAIQSITAAGVDIGFIMEAVVLAAVGLSVWRKMP